MNTLIDSNTGEQLAQYQRPAIKTPLNAKHFPESREYNYQPSKTLPDQTLSLKELLDRYTRGLPISGPQMHPVFNGDEDFFPDVRRMDISEIHDLKQLVKEDIQNQKDDLTKQQTAKQKAAAAKSQAELDKLAPKKEDPTNAK